MEPIAHSTSRASFSSLTDSDLVSLANSGQPEAAFRQIALRYREKIYWTARRLVVSHDDAEDVTQETIISIWTKLPTFRSESSLWSWIYRIAVNASLALLRRNSVHTHIPVESEASHLFDEGDLDAALLSEEKWRHVDRAVSALPPRQRLVFDLRVFGDIRYEEMTRMLNRSTGTLKANFHHALRKIVATAGASYSDN